MANLLAPAVDRSAEAPFDEVHWISDKGAAFDMCPPTIVGIRTERNDFGAIITAKVLAYPDHTITTCMDAIREKTECVIIDGLTVRLLSVGRRCRKNGCRFCWEPLAEVPDYTSPEESHSRSSPMMIPSVPPSDLQSVTQRPTTIK